MNASLFQGPSRQLTPRTIDEGECGVPISGTRRDVME
jgi:hypothetical protein